MSIQVGEPVTVRTASGETVEMIALSEVEPGQDFMIVWVCSPAEATAARTEGREPKGVPWPASAVIEGQPSGA